MFLTSPTSGGHSVGIVHLRTMAMEFSLVLVYVNVSDDATINILFCTMSIIEFLFF
jgi:hypothetical protein